MAKAQRAPKLKLTEARAKKFDEIYVAYNTPSDQIASKADFRMAFSKLIRAKLRLVATDDEIMDLMVSLRKQGALSRLRR